jgi:hypothetical protein
MMLNLIGIINANKTVLLKTGFQIIIDDPLCIFIEIRKF